MELAAAEETSWSKLGVDEEGASLIWMARRRTSGVATRERHERQTAREPQLELAERARMVLSGGSGERGREYAMMSREL